MTERGYLEAFQCR